MYRIFRFAIVAIGAALATTQLSHANSDICVRMQERLDQLTLNRDPDDYELRLRRDRVEAALDANNCPVADAPVRDQPLYDTPQRDEPRRDVPRYEQPRRDAPLYDEPRRAASEPPDYDVLGSEPEQIDPELSTAPAYGGRYQTLCVRSCDGYYFPLSYDTGAENFSRDQAQCQSQCPGAKLFYRPTDSQDAGAMISLRGDLYKNMPNAFKFRKAGATATPQCSCQKAAGDFKTLGDPQATVKESQKPAVSAKPAEPPKTAEPAKPEQPPLAKTEPAAPAATPATQASSIIQLGEPQAAKTEVEKPKPLTEDKPIDPNRKVRVVGPAFLPDQAGATNPPAQDQKSAQ